MRAMLAKSVCLVVLSLSSAAIAQVAPPDMGQKAGDVVALPHDDRPLVQVAILLDTSNSMDGLIAQAQKQLWTIVNEISQARREGKMPRLQVALIEYGNDNLAAGEGYIRTVLPLTDNLDQISEKLFALTTNGGSEFCGHAIQQATQTLAWSPDPKVYKVIFIAGNEPFGQGNVDYHTSCSSAIGRGLVVNTIHCGERQVGVETGWAEGAKLGEGYFTNIDQNRDTKVIRCPQDEMIEKLSIEINVTYVPYGAAGAESSERQAAQDSNAMASAASGSAVQRAQSKAGANYDNRGWDLVDAVTTGAVDLAKLDSKELPEAMQKMTPEQQKAYVLEQAKKRTELRDQINKLIAERAKFLAEQPTTAPAGEKTLDAAMTEALRDQLKGRQYEVDGK